MWQRWYDLEYLFAHEASVGWQVKDCNVKSRVSKDSERPNMCQNRALFSMRLLNNYFLFGKHEGCAL